MTNNFLPEKYSTESVYDNLDKILTDKEKLIYLIDLQGEFERFWSRQNGIENELLAAFQSIAANDFRHMIEKEIARLEKRISLNPSSNEPMTMVETISGPVNEMASSNVVISPIFIEPIYCNLENLFLENDKPLLKSLLEGNPISRKITFLKSGNQLADIFKQLFHQNIVIIRGDKKDLEAWLLKNFRYHDMTKKGRIADFNPHYLDKQISGKVDPCKNPLFTIFVDSSQNLCFDPVESKQKRSNY